MGRVFSLSGIAEQAQVQPSTLVRFSQALGYQGFSDMQEIFRSRLRVPVDIYEGPAMNHSFHEMTIGHGRCLSTVLLSRKAESIPEAGYTADYHRAQFLATQIAYLRRAMVKQGIRA